MSLDAFRTYIERNSHNSVLIVDQTQRILYSNNVFHTLTGYSGQVVSGQPLGRLLALDKPLELWRFIDSNEASDDGYCHASVQCSSGETLSCPCAALKIEVDGLIYFLITLRTSPSSQDISLIRQFGSMFIKDVNLGVLLINKDFQLTDISDVACRLLGFSKYDVLYRSMDEIFAYVPSEHRLVQRTILDGMVDRNRALSWTNNQERYELLLDSNVLKDTSGSIVGAYVMFKDVTNLRSLEQQVQRSDRLAMIGQIAAGTAHEIRNPLTSIKGFLQVLRRTFEIQGMHKETEYTEVMLAEINRINELVSEFLLLSKPKHVSYVEVDVPNVLREIMPIIYNEAILHGVTVHYEASGSLPKVIADAELLKQVFLNIGKNGIEAMVDGGHLTVTERVDLEERRVHIDIHDTGPGIPLFVIDKIFDPFFTTKAEGTGLGLSVCQRIIHDMGGSIRVSAKGFGTTFTVSIPFP
ncbi:PAS domain-containing protein [Paenibacillus thalictri]|uniref:histidine kinase n=2 Tax=Paenibacillus thalictri TaxID=2527873 RepID=A0A4Q9DI86_9BACL|nr:PAS domain-containing protein [Paenibacillus thalictri]